MKTRVRFAPSPTGFFHIGSARTALFNWLYARHTGGTFVLRIEDTDHERNTEEALTVLKDGMRWLGMDWDEGPDVGGEYGPYFQSRRDDIYAKYLEILRKNGRAYDKDGAVFFKVSGEEQVLHDAVYGNVARTEEKDFPIFRSNGTPVFHFVNVVDDICMEITHVIRGQDHLTNTNKHLELFKAFGAPLPQFAHIPLILKSDGQGKMSKRDRGALIEEYQQKKFLPEAVVNYLSLLGWNPKNDREIMSAEEIAGLFDFPGIVKSNARFDERKMAHFNTEHIRMLPADKFRALALETVKEAENIDLGSDGEYVKKVFALCQPKASNMESFPSMVDYFFTDEYAFDETAKERVFKKGDPLARLAEVKEIFEKLDSLDAEKTHDAIAAYAEAKGVKPTEFFSITRFAVSGHAGGPDLFPMLEVLGKDRVLRRIAAALKSLA